MFEGITEKVVDFAVSTKFNDLPRPVIHKTKQIIFDSVGCAFGGYITDRAKIAIELAEYLGGKPQASIIGGHKTSYALAAFVNGELINALDYDLGGNYLGHLPAPVIPPGLAMGELSKASGKELITAVAVGLEIGSRIRRSLAQHRVSKEESPYWEWSPRFGWTTAIFGGVASAGKILGLDRQKMANAFGIAGASTPVPAHMKWEHTQAQTMTKYNNWQGWMAHLATVTVLVAEKGFTGDTTILDGEWGFWKIFGSPFFEAETLVGGLGKEWCVDQVQWKYYPCCYCNHSIIEAISRIVQENKIDPADIDDIEIKCDYEFLNTPNRTMTEIKSFCDTQFCNTYIAAVAAYYGHKPSPSWQSPTTFSDPAITNLMKKVRITPHPRTEELIKKAFETGLFPSFFNTIVDIFANGEKYTAEVNATKGFAENPVTDEELEAKFRHNATFSILRSDKVEKIIEMIYDLEKVNDITELTSCLTVS